MTIAVGLGRKATNKQTNSLIRGGRIQTPLLAGRWPASETPFKMAFCWWADDDPTLNAGKDHTTTFVILRGSGQVLLRNPIFL